MTARALPRAQARQLHQVIRRRRPTIIAGLLDGQPQPTLAELVRTWGDRVVPVAPVVDGVAYVASAGVEYTAQPLRDVVASLEGGGGGMVSARPEDYLPGVSASLPSFDPGRGARWRRSRIWISPAHSVTPLHHEVTHNLLAQLQGRKEVTLYPPWQRRAMYPHPPWTRIPHMSRVAAHAPDLRAHPRFARANPWRGELDPGDVLFIPAFWWHWVRTFDASLSYNLWFAGGAVAALARGMELYKRLRKLSI